MSTQSRNRSYEQGGQNGAEMAPDVARLAEFTWGRLAMQESLWTMFGAPIAGAAGAAVATREMQNPLVGTDTRPENAGNENVNYINQLAADVRPEFVPASQEVREYTAQQPAYAAPAGAAPQLSETQQYTQYAQALATPTPGVPQPVAAPSSLGGQVNGF